MENQRGIAQSLSTALTVETIHLDEIVLEAITKGWDFFTEDRGQPLI